MPSAENEALIARLLEVDAELDAMLARMEAGELVDLEEIERIRARLREAQDILTAASDDGRSEGSARSNLTAHGAPDARAGEGAGVS